KASRMGVSIEEVAQTLQFALSNKRLGYFNRNGKQYQVLGQVSRDNREAPLDLKLFYVRSNTGEMVTIDNLVVLEETTSPAQMYHYNRYKSATVSAGLAPGYTIGDGLEAMDGIYDQLKEEG